MLGLKCFTLLFHFEMLFFGTKPVVSFRNVNANIKDEMLELFQAVNQGELSWGSSYVYQFHIRPFPTCEISCGHFLLKIFFFNICLLKSNSKGQIPWLVY